MQVLPGDTVPSASKYGPGIDNGRALVAGTIKESNGTVFVDTNFKRYTPAVKDMVVGVIKQRASDVYRVSLQPFSKPVRLNQMAFENATKKNKPNLEVGDVVYARVTSADRNLDAEIECFDSKTGKAAGFGQLKGGTVISVRLGFARELLFKGHPILDKLAKQYSYDLAIGVNGQIWVKGPDAKSTLHIANAISEASDASAH